MNNSGDAGLPEEFFNTNFEHTCLKSALIFYEINIIFLLLLCLL